MYKCKLFCINNEQTLVADVLEQTDKYVKVVVEGTDIAITMKRSSNREPYLGYVGKLIFETSGNINLK